MCQGKSERVAAQGGQNGGGRVGSKTGEKGKHSRRRNKCHALKEPKASQGGWRVECRGACRMRLRTGGEQGPQAAQPGGI